MVYIKPITNFITRNNNNVANGIIQTPKAPSTKPKFLGISRPKVDEFCPSFQKKTISLEEVKKLFPKGKLDTRNHIYREMERLSSKIKTSRKVIDLDPKLTEEDYKIIQDFMNKENGKYIEGWKGKTDGVSNMQKLALFARTMKLTDQEKDFLEFNPAQWDTVYEGVVKKPKELILPIFKYKINSNIIHGPLSDNKITKEVKKDIDGITKFLDMFSVKNSFVAYRGDKSFNILSGVKYEGQNINLAELMEITTNKLRQDFLNGKYNEKEVDSFVQEYLIEQKVEQPRFMSIGMTESAIESYVEKIKWEIEIPAGTKGASIESYNIERANEAEFLGQRNGVLKIRNAKYNPEEDLWYFTATLEQNPIDEIKVNC